MTRSLIAVVLLATAVSGGALAAPPADVEAFFKRAESCVHFAGETVENPATAEEKKRAAELAKKQRQFCTGNKKRLAALKAKHKTAEARRRIGEAEKLLNEAGILE